MPGPTKDTLQRVVLEPVEITAAVAVDVGTKAITKKNTSGLSFKRLLTEINTHPFDKINWIRRDSRILDEKGNTIFELKDVEVPDFFSQLATDIAVSKYFRKAGVPETGHETSFKQLVVRVARTIRKVGEQLGGYFATKTDAATFEMELTHLLVRQMVAFNSPVWFNCGLWHEYGIDGSSGNWAWNRQTDQIEMTQNAYEQPQCSACFIQSVKDDILSIFDLAKSEAKLFKYGSGTGTNFSNIRGKGEKLSGGGTSSGLMSFLEVLDRGAGSIKSGGTTRRAAKMVVLDIDHPEIVDFIEWKVREEKKAKLLIASGEYSSDFNGEAYHTVSGQNSNNSVRVSDEFMQAYLENREWPTIARTTGEIIDTYKAKELMDKIAQSAWTCADPGIQFDTTINRWHTCPKSGRINSSNPCSEYMFLDDSSCNLASLNLIKFVDQAGKFEIKQFEHSVEIMITAMEIIIDLASYPTEEIARNSHNFRPLGLGYANLGTLLMNTGIPYDSDSGRAWASALTSIMHSRAYAQSALLAKAKGPFKEYAMNREPMLNVIDMHRDAVYQIPSSHAPDYLTKSARQNADRMLELAKKYGLRNAQATLIAPTGTIALLMDCDTTGVEPDFALVKFKKLAGGGFFKIVNQSVPTALKNLGYADGQIEEIIRYAVGSGSLDGAPFINRTSLAQKGLSEDDIDAVNRQLPGSFELEHAFTQDTIGTETLQNIGITPAQLNDFSFSLLKYLGFTPEQIETANQTICGMMTLEGAPHLKPEHLPVFDCANRCGNYGTRSIDPTGHTKMMAAVQPFISGAISKTVNLPKETTVEEIENIYVESWKMGIKAIAIYRDGSKGSQPLSSGVEKKSAPEIETRIEYRVLRRRLPDERQALTHKFSIAGHKGFVTVGMYEDGTLGEIFISMNKEGTVISGLLDAFATSISYALQYGVPLKVLVNKFTHVRFEPSGFTKNSQIPIAKSIVDYIFRWLAIKFLPQEDWSSIGIHVDPGQLEELPPPAEQPPINNENSLEQPNQPELKLAENISNQGISNPYDVTGDAPTCDICGGMMTRSGTCYKCMNCGSTSSCS